MSPREYETGRRTFLIGTVLGVAAASFALRAFAGVASLAGRVPAAEHAFFDGIRRAGDGHQHVAAAAEKYRSSDFGSV